MTVGDTSWMARGSCRHLPSVTFFPNDGGGVAVAKHVCARCPVREECLEFALSRHIAHGVWGGTSERGRQLLAAARRQVLRSSGQEDRESTDEVPRSKELVDR
jgi:WhiB family redox-sensing transcriptional regulator